MHSATVLGAVLLSSALAQAQTTQTAATPATPPAEEEEIVVLSPFEVRASAEAGYQERETLAGTRIRTDLRDVGSAISVVNQQLLQDIGATSSQSLLQYTVSTEVGGAQGNFMVGSLVGDAAIINDNEARRNPQNNTRVRGLNAADNTRDFYLTDIPWDSYNTSRIDIQRGANSILFGNGSGAGIINGSIDGASLARSSGVLEGRYGSYGAYRGSLNINRVLIDDELAVRFATVFDKDQYRQDPAFNQDHRTYGAVRWEPAFLKKGGARTSIKVSFEHGDITANRPRLNTINDGISTWFRTANEDMISPYATNENGDTYLGTLTPLKSHAGYDPFVVGIGTSSLITGNPNLRDIGARTNSNFGANPNAEPWLGAYSVSTAFGATAIGPGMDRTGFNSWTAVFEDPTSPDMSRIMFNTIGNGIMYYAVNSNGVRDGHTPTGLRGPDTTALLTLGDYAFRGVGDFKYTNMGIYRSQTITDSSVFDFYNKLLDGPTKREGSKFNAFNAAIDQTFWNDKAGFQIALDHQEYSDYNVASLNNPILYIDIYRNLPAATLNAATGLLEPVANPNFGRPYVISQSTGNFRSTTKRVTQRFTPYADLDFKDLMKTDNILTKLLGRHLITGLYERHQYERETATWSRQQIDANQAGVIFGPNTGVNSTARNIAGVHYLGPDIHTASSLSGAGLSNLQAEQLVRNVTTAGNASAPVAWYFNSNWNGTPTPATAGAAFTSPALGLAPNATGTTSTQMNNPLNYGAWGTGPRTLAIANADFGNERELTTTSTKTKNKITSYALVDQWSLLDRTVVLIGGLRKDKIKTYTPGNPLLAPDDIRRTGSRDRINNGAVDWDAPFEFPDSPSAVYNSPTLKTYGIVLHTPDALNQKLPWGLQASVFYSQSENFRPEIRKDVITGANLEPSSGETKDYGVTISALDGKISLKVNRYETVTKNATLQDNSVISFIADEITQGIRFGNSVKYIQRLNERIASGETPTPTPGSRGNNQYDYRATPSSGADTGLTGSNPLLDTSNHYYPWEPARPSTSNDPWTLAEWQAEEAHAIRAADAFFESLQTPMAQQFLAAWGLTDWATRWSYNLSNNNVSATRPANVQVTGDTESRGWEFEFFARPTSSWNIMVNAAKTFATRTNMAGNISEWLQTRWELYNERDTLTDNGLLAGDIRWFGGGQGNVSSGQARFGRNGYRFFSEFRSREGVNVPELRPWRFTLINNYSFNGEFLKGVFVGGGFRWEDKSVVGFGVTETSPQQTAVVSGRTVELRAPEGALDVNKPYYSPEEKHFDVWVGYNHKLTKDIDWRLQLNIRNAFEGADVVPISANPDGSGAAYRITEGMTWELTSSFRF